MRNLSPRNITPKPNDKDIAAYQGFLKAIGFKRSDGAIFGLLALSRRAAAVGRDRRHARPLAGRGEPGTEESFPLGRRRVALLAGAARPAHTARWRTASRLSRRFSRNGRRGRSTRFAGRTRRRAIGSSRKGCGREPAHPAAGLLRHDLRLRARHHGFRDWALAPEPSQSQYSRYPRPAEGSRALPQGAKTVSGLRDGLGARKERPMALNDRVVITGVGLTAPNGNNLAAFREALLTRKSGVRCSRRGTWEGVRGRLRFRRVPLPEAQGTAPGHPRRLDRDLLRQRGAKGLRARDPERSRRAPSSPGAWAFTSASPSTGTSRRKTRCGICASSRTRRSTGRTITTRAPSRTIPPASSA